MENKTTELNARIRRTIVQLARETEAVRQSQLFRDYLNTFSSILGLLLAQPGEFNGVMDRSTALPAMLLLFASACCYPDVEEHMMAQFRQNTSAQVMTRLTELLGLRCTIKVKNVGEIRGVVEQIAAPVLTDDLQRSVDLTQFEVRLESGETVTIPGSDFSKIEYA